MFDEVPSYDDAKLKLVIKNMVCYRCKIVVRNELEKLGVEVLNVELGEVEILKPLSANSRIEIGLMLGNFGFELLEDKRSRTIMGIKREIVTLIHHSDSKLDIKLSEYLASRLNQDYSKLSKLFSDVENTTIEKYFINQKIEKVKELLIYDELSLSEISYRLNYSSVAYLSNQFKKVTGFTPSYYKARKEPSRRQIDDV